MAYFYFFIFSWILAFIPLKASDLSEEIDGFRLGSCCIVKKYCGLSLPWDTDEPRYLFVLLPPEMQTSCSQPISFNINPAYHMALIQHMIVILSQDIENGHGGLRAFLIWTQVLKMLKELVKESI